MNQKKGFRRPDSSGERLARASSPSRGVGRRFLKVSTLALVGLLVGGTALLTPTKATSAPPQVLEYKFADVQPAQGIYGRYEVKFGKLLSERTGGAVLDRHGSRIFSERIQQSLIFRGFVQLLADPFGQLLHRDEFSLFHQLSQKGHLLIR